MKFILVGLAFPFRGGIAHYTSCLYRELSKRHEVLTLSFQKQYPALLFPATTQLDQSREFVQIPAEPLLDPFNWTTWNLAARRIVDYAPHAVIFQWWQPFFGLAYRSVALKVRRQLRVPLLLICHNVHAHERPRVPGARHLERLLIQGAFTRFDGFMVHAEKLLQEVRQYNHGAPVKKMLLPEFDLFPLHDSSDNSQGDSLRVLFFGNIREYKGLDSFLKALGFLRGKIPFRATIAGEFYVKPEPYLELARELGISEWVTWENRYIPNEDVGRIFGNTDLLVLPYRDASQSGIIPLAYRFSVPVLATDVGGISEVVKDGETGFLVPPDRPLMLSERMLEFHQRNLKIEFQRNIRKFRTQLNWSQVVGTILELLEVVKAGVGGK
ncbi:MAG: glycosyltransferase [Acidobacteria bacterium]|nr:glycosyltransferase [Acidobacteriota bacterium]